MITQMILSGMHFWNLHTEVHFSPQLYTLSDIILEYQAVLCLNKVTFFKPLQIFIKKAENGFKLRCLLKLPPSHHTGFSQASLSMYS